MVECVSVVGAGTIGASWAALFLAHGLSVRIFDPAPNCGVFVRDYVKAACPDLKRLGLAVDSAPEHVDTFERLSDCLKGADFVQESVPERMELKRSIYGEIERYVRPDIVIATSASGLKVSDLQAGMKRPERLVLA